jgi:hypothetical protein
MSNSYVQNLELAAGRHQQVQYTDGDVSGIARKHCTDGATKKYPLTQRWCVPRPAAC